MGRREWVWSISSRAFRKSSCFPLYLSFLLKRIPAQLLKFMVGFLLTITRNAKPSEKIVLPASAAFLYGRADIFLSYVPVSAKYWGVTQGTSWFIIFIHRDLFFQNRHSQELKFTGVTCPNSGILTWARSLLTSFENSLIPMDSPTLLSHRFCGVSFLDYLMHYFKLLEYSCFHKLIRIVSNASFIGESNDLCCVIYFHCKVLRKSFCLIDFPFSG